MRCFVPATHAADAMYLTVHLCALLCLLACCAAFYGRRPPPPTPNPFASLSPGLFLGSAGAVMMLRIWKAIFSVSMLPYTINTAVFLSMICHVDPALLARSSLCAIHTLTTIMCESRICHVDSTKLVLSAMFCHVLPCALNSAGVWQAVLMYAQLMSILGMLEVKWPSILQGLFKAMSWITHIAPRVECLTPSLAAQAS